MPWNEFAGAGKILASQLLNTADPGTSYAVVGPVMNVTKYKQLVVDQIVEAATGSTPTMDMKIQESSAPDDADSWIDVPGGGFTQRTTTATERLIFPDGTTEVFGPFIRLQAKIGGTTPVFTTTVYVTGKV